MQTLVDRKMFYYGGVHHATYNSDRCRAPAEHTLVNLPDIDAPFRCAVGIKDQEMRSTSLPLQTKSCRCICSCLQYLASAARCCHLSCKEDRSPVFPGPTGHCRVPTLDNSQRQCTSFFQPDHPVSDLGCSCLEKVSIHDFLSIIHILTVMSHPFLTRFARSSTMLSKRTLHRRPSIPISAFIFLSCSENTHANECLKST